MTPSLKTESASEDRTAQPQAATAGQLLRQARQKTGMHLAVLSVTLKVPVRQLEALEADELDPGKGPVFYRGLASSMCRQSCVAIWAIAHGSTPSLLRCR